MKTIIAVPGQSVIDIALLYCGDATLAYTIATLNNISITLTFTIATSILIPDNTNNISIQYQKQGISFATGIIDNIPLDVPWLLENKVWNDAAYWNDAATWND